MPPGVDACTEVAVSAQVLVEGLLVDDGAAGDVDEDRGRLHQGQFARAEQAASGVGQRQRDDEDVGRGQHLIRGRRACRRSRRLLWCGPRCSRRGSGRRTRASGGRWRRRCRRTRGWRRRRRPASATGSAWLNSPLASAACRCGRRLASASVMAMTCSAIGLAYAPTLPASGTGLGNGAEVDAVGARREQLDEPEFWRLVQGACGQLLAQVPADQRLCPRAGSPAAPPLGARLRKRTVASSLSTSALMPGVFLVYRVAHGHETLAGHWSSFCRRLAVPPVPGCPTRAG